MTYATVIVWSFVQTWFFAIGGVYGGTDRLSITIYPTETQCLQDRERSTAHARACLGPYETQVPLPRSRPMIDGEVANAR